MSWPAELQRILLVRLDNLGDVVLLGPAAAAIRARYPEAAITLLASHGGAEAAALLSQIDDVIRHRPVWQELQPGRESAAAELSLIEELRARDFEAAIVFSSFAQSALPAAMACFLAGIPLRAGYAERFAGQLLTHPVVAPPDPTHEAARNVHLVRSLGIEAASTALSIEPPAAALAAADAALESLGVREPFIVLAPGASAPARRYPAGRLAVVAAEAGRLGLDVLVTGSSRERPLLEAVVDGADHGYVFSIVPDDVGMLAGIVRRSAAVVCNNSLTMHLAEALRVPSVVTYAGTDLEVHWRPRSTPALLLRRTTGCSPCHLLECTRASECLEIAPAQVIDALTAFVPATARAAEATPMAAPA